MNRFSRDTGIGQRQVTTIPLPFEALQQSLMMKQAKYDQAETFEIQNKAEIGALNSPIAGHQKYLDEYKTNYLNEANSLHSSIADKGSSEYRRKLQELVSKYSSDRNRQLIERSNAEYSKYATDRSKKMSENKYSPAADFYQNFTGLDEKTGTILPFTYAGMRDRVDWKKETQDLIKNTPEEEGSTKRQDPLTGTSTEYTFKRKTKNSILNSFNTLLSKEALQDMQYELGIKDSKSLNKTLEQIANTGVYNNVDTGIKYDFDRLDQATQASTGGWVDYGTADVDKNKVNLFNDLIGKNGEIIPTDATWSEGYNSNTKDEGILPGSGMLADIGKGINNLIGGAFQPKSEEYTINRLRENGVPIDNLKMSAERLGLPLSKVLAAYRDKATSPMKYRVLPISNEKERTATEHKLQGTFASLNVIDKATNIPLTNEEKTAIALGKIAVAGRLNPDNHLSPLTYAATVGYEDAEGNKFQKEVLVPYTKDANNDQDLNDNYLHAQEASLQSGNLTRLSGVFITENKLGQKVVEYSPEGSIFEVTINPITGAEIKKQIPYKQ